MHDLMGQVVFLIIEMKQKNIYVKSRACAAVLEKERKSI